MAAWGSLVGLQIWQLAFHRVHIPKDQSRSCECYITRQLPHSIVLLGPAQIQGGKGPHEELDNRRPGSLWGLLWRLGPLLGCPWAAEWKEHLPRGALVMLEEMNTGVSSHGFIRLMSAVIITSPWA